MGHNISATSDMRQRENANAPSDWAWGVEITLVMAQQAAAPKARRSYREPKGL
jgi:hypothetical protein